MPKCEIFDRSDFHDFCTLKSQQEGDFRVKIKKIYKIVRGSFGAAKFLTHMLCLILRSAVPSKHAEHTHQGLMRTLSIRDGSGTDAFAEHMHQFLHVCSA